MSEFESGLWDRDDFNNQEEEISDSDIYEEEEFEEEFEEGDLIFDNEEFDDFLEKESNVVNDARIRLEQGRLYEMLIKHNLFDNVDAAPEAIANVEREMKDFIMERLEILLGMRAEKEQSQVTQIVNDPQFNELEVTALKQVAAKLTKGASTVAPPVKQQENELNTVKTVKKQNTLNSLGSAKTATTAPKVKTSKPLPKSSKKRVRKVKKDVLNKKTSSVQDAAKKDIKYLESLKNMSLEDANAVVSQRHSRPRPKSQLNTNGSDEQQTQDMINSIYQQKMSMNNTANTFTTLLKAAKKI